MRYTIIQPTGRYSARVAEANAAAVEHACAVHIQVHADTSPDPTTDRTLGIYFTDSPAESRGLAEQLADDVALRVPLHVRPTVKGWAELRGPGQKEDRGHVCLRGSAIPAALLELGMLTAPPFAAWAPTDAGVSALAEGIVATIRRAMVNGGLVVISAGHEGGNGHAGDHGAEANGVVEAVICGRVVGKVVELLQAME